MSADDGSDGLVSDRWKLEPSSTGLSVEKVPVGATFLTVTVSEYAVMPPSLSRILASTLSVPLSDVEQVADASAANAP